MPVEERLRNALADLAEQVRVDAERPLEHVRRRRQRRVATVWAGTAAAVVALLAVAVTLLPQPTPRPEPVGPPSGERSHASTRTIPFARYVRTVTDDQARDAGFRRDVVADLFAGAGRARVELVFRARRGSSSEVEDWSLWFVDARGERRIGDAGYYYPTGEVSYEHDGELVLVSPERHHYVFSWELEGGSLVFEPVPKTTDRPTAVLLGEGTWERQEG